MFPVTGAGPPWHETLDTELELPTAGLRHPTPSDARRDRRTLGRFGRRKPIPGPSRVLAPECLFCGRTGVLLRPRLETVPPKVELYMRPLRGRCVRAHGPCQALVADAERARP